MASKPSVKCSDYRAEQRLLALERQLSQNNLSSEERARLEAEIAELERLLGMD